MMEFFQTLSKLLMIPSAILLVWDLIEGWFVKNTLKLRNVKEWGDKISTTGYAHVHNSMHNLLPTNWDTIEKMPAFLVVFGIGFFFYLLYRLIFLLKGGNTGGYKSRY